VLILEEVKEVQETLDTSFLNIPVRVIVLVEPEAVLFIERHYKELSVCFLFYYHCMKGIHLVDKPILGFAAFRDHIHELAFGFHLC
jgi:hypothetical protein